MSDSPLTHAIKRLKDSLEEVRRVHRDPADRDGYNECDKAECAWCDWTREDMAIIEAALLADTRAATEETCGFTVSEDDTSPRVMRCVLQAGHSGHHVYGKPTTDGSPWVATRAATEGGEKRRPLPTNIKAGCLFCGEKHDGGYETQHGIGPFCSSCWSLLDEYFSKSAASAPTRETGWQPIETAPKDGTNILLSDGMRVSQGGWLSETAQGADYEGQFNTADWWSVDSIEMPTLWHPMPSLPTPPRDERPQT